MAARAERLRGLSDDVGNHERAAPAGGNANPNGYAPDSRLQKQAHTLAAAGFRVTKIVAWNRCIYPVTRAARRLLAETLRTWPGGESSSRSR